MTTITNSGGVEHRVGAAEWQRESSKKTRVRVPGVLLLFEDPLVRDASTISEHIDAFARHSRFAWYPVNVTFGLPSALARYEFAAAVFHYSLRPTYAWLKGPLGEYAVKCAPYKVAIFQDEIWYFRERRQFLTHLRIDCLYSRHKPHHIHDVYGLHPPVKKFEHYLAGYVSDDLVRRAARLARPYKDRPIDVGYRGRRLPYHFGRGGQEKGIIAERLVELVVDRGLTLDVSSDETDRLYGPDWDSFLANCKAVLGVEGGVSVVDQTDRFRALYDQMIQENPWLTFAEFEAAAGPEFQALEDRIDYRSLTPRHFESAAFRNLQILFEGRYDGLLKPWVHYVPLRKDFNNLDEVLAVLADPAGAARIIERAYDDLIGSGRYAYAHFVRSFDEHLIAGGVPPNSRPSWRQDRRLRAYLAEWDRFESRARRFEDALWRLSVESRKNSRVARAGRARLAEYRERVNARDPDRSFPAKRWVRHVRERLFWQRLEGEFGQRLLAPVHDRRRRDLLGRVFGIERLMRKGRRRAE